MIDLVVSACSSAADLADGRTYRESINGVDKTVSNTYLAGAKQLFVPNPSTGGINIQTGPLPTNPAAGDLALDADDANKLKMFDGSAWNTMVAASNYVETFTSQTVL